MTRIRAAAIQLCPVLDSADGTVERVLAAIADAAGRGVQLAVFPETCIPYYPYFSFVQAPATMGARHTRLYEHSVRIPGPVTQAVGQAARKHGMHVLLGVNERDHGTVYNAQLLFDDSGTIVLRRRKISPSFHERMVWGQGDGSGLRVVDTVLGRIGALACWENFNPLARAALMAQHEEIHCTHFPGSMAGPTFAAQIEAAVRHHAAEAGCFVVNATGWLTDAQIASITEDPAMRKALRGGTCSAIISPEGVHLAEKLTEGEGMVVADLDMDLIVKRKRMMDSVGHYARPDLLRLRVRTTRQDFADFSPSHDALHHDRSDADDADDNDGSGGALDHRSAIPGAAAA
jgi:aliphatic nitrilase